MDKQKVKRIVKAILIVVGVLLFTALAFTAVILKQIADLPH